ncbi:unnamed protein product [Malus baccata var. baccata]
MFLCNNSIQETHYEILSVKQDASYEDIRASYRSAILDSHPDKSQSTSGSGDRFLKVQKAWEILGDSRSRALYDSALRASSLDAMVAEDISLKDVMAEDAGEAIQLFYQCRCGDYFFVDSLELEEMGYALLRDGRKISFEAQNALPASLVIPCGYDLFLLYGHRSSSDERNLIFIKDCVFGYFKLKFPVGFLINRKQEMGSAEKSSQWRSVFDGVKLKTIKAMPEALMAEINTAICNLEYARATALVDSPSSSSSTAKTEIPDQPEYNARIADQAYKAGCAALAAGKLDEALLSLNTSLSMCPPDQTSAVTKLHSLISLTSRQLHNIFYHEDEQSPNPSKRCKFLAACLTDAFANCHTGRKLSVSSHAEECLTSDFDEEQEVIVSAIRSRAMEKLRRKPRSFSDSFSFVYSSKSGDLFITQKGVEKQEDHEDDEKADFLSVASCLSCCSSDAASRDVFLSVKTSLSRCSSLNGIEFRDFPNQSIIQQFRHCEGWPFGLCRKAVLLPPLPKSPSESWLWKKGTKFVKMV